MVTRAAIQPKQPKHVGKLVSVAGIVINASRMHAKATHVCHL
jgi:DNA replicative helicase MCM subunit Mcm2 (Cdc46/Mcm family)